MWKKVDYSKSQINKAGRTILKDNVTEEEEKESLKIIDNWRAAHAFPMNTFAIRLKHITESIPHAIVVQRLKRLDTIIHKLRRFPKMELYRMQDLGGCRVIVETIPEVYEVVSKLRKSRIRHEEHNYKDYIANPNSQTGYRGYHIIYRYKSDKKEDYNGLQVEIQIRTRLQHLWATAVETVGVFTDNGLKFNQGSEQWLYFFKLVSALFAIEEKSAVPDDLPNDPQVIVFYLANVMRELKVLEKLYTIGLATDAIGHISKKKAPGYYLLILDIEKLELRFRIFPGVEKGLDDATDEYNRIEKEKGSKRIDAVLVSATSYEQLVYAYPNYFANIREFTDELNRIMKKHAKQLSKAIANRK